MNNIGKNSYKEMEVIVKNNEKSSNKWEKGSQSFHSDTLFQFTYIDYILRFSNVYMYYYYFKYYNRTENRTIKK